MTYKFRQANFDFQFSDEDFANPNDMIPAGEFNPHNVRTFLLHDAGFVVAVVFADCLQDALDEAVDRGKLDRFQVSEAELKDYETGERSDVGSEWAPEGYPEYRGITHLGNASEPFDIESLDVVEVPTSQWGPEYWTVGQLEQAVENLEDGWDGRTESWKTANQPRLEAYKARLGQLEVK